MNQVSPHKYPAESVLSILLDKAIPAHKICSKRPLNITRSATYVVDVSKLAHPDDVKQDSFGIWNHWKYQLIYMEKLTKLTKLTKHASAQTLGLKYNN